MHNRPLNRREFSKRAVGTIAALGSLGSVASACASLPTAASIRPDPTPLDARRAAALSGADMAAWRQVAQLARLVPTPHNTQPFRIRPIDARTAEIVALGERFLPAEDDGNLYMASAFGIMAATIEMAAKAHGLDARVSPVASLDVAALHTATSPTLLGTASIVGPEDMQVQIPRYARDDNELLHIRRTSRIPYDGRLVLRETWERLAAATASHGHQLIEHHDPDVVRRTLRLNVDALLDNLRLTDERREIQRWYRLGPTPQFGDGLWEKPMNQDSFEIKAAFGSPGFFGLPVVRQVARRDYLATQRGTRHILLLHGPFAGWPDLVAAGRALFGLWIGMAQAGVYVQPMGSMLTNPRYAAEVARRFDVTDCWLVMRAGYSAEPPRAPRLASILI